MSEKKNHPPKHNNGKNPAAVPPPSASAPSQAPAGHNAPDKPGAAQDIKPAHQAASDKAAEVKKTETDHKNQSAKTDNHKTEAMSAGKAPEKTPEKAPEQSQNTPPRREADKNAASAPPPPPKHKSAESAKEKRGNGLSLIALVVSVIALGWGIYQSSQNSALRGNIDALQSKLNALGEESGKNGKDIDALRADLGNIAIPAPGMDRDSVVKTIAENNAQLEKSLADSLSAYQGEVDKRFAALPKTLDRGNVQSLIKQELATFAQNQDGQHPAIDFSDEIAKVEASEASAKQILAHIEQSSAALDSRLQQALADAEKRLSEISDNRASVLNLLTLAQLAGHAGQYQGAAQYLQQAGSHLAGGEHEQWQGTLADAAQHYQQLASQPSPTAALENLIARVDEWPMRAAEQDNLIAPAADSPPQTMMDKVKHAGQEILAHTVSVVPLDDGGLSWINHNPALQNIIRENVRLDLAFARNALHMRDSAAYAQIVSPLKASIERYFDSDNSEVKAALDVLGGLDNTPQALPDLAPVIQALRSAQ